MRSFAEKLGSLYDIDAFNKLQDKRSDALVELFLHVGEDEVQWVLLALDKMVSARTAYRDKLIEMSFLEILTEVNERINISGSEIIFLVLSSISC